MPTETIFSSTDLGREYIHREVFDPKYQQMIILLRETSTLNEIIMCLSTSVVRCIEEYANGQGHMLLSTAKLHAEMCRDVDSLLKNLLDNRYIESRERVIVRD